MGLITLDVKTAFQEPGCPICRLRYRSEQRYIYNLLWENVTDGGIRAMLVQSLGFCHTHSWQLQETEQSQWNDGLGTGIIYEDLIERALAGLKTFARQTERMTVQNAGRRWRSRWRNLFSRWTKGYAKTGLSAGDFLPHSLVPRSSCRVCDLGHTTETTYLTWLIRGCADEAFREAYAASDGLCLPHLRHALTLAQQEEPDAMLYLVDVAQKKTRRLTHTLGEYVRKHNWQFRHETMQPEEQASWRRTVAFFAGEKRPAAGSGHTIIPPQKNRTP